MHLRLPCRPALPLLLCLLACLSLVAQAATQRLLYVATPGVRNLLEYGGHGLVVFDIDHNHRFVKRIPLAGLDEKGAPLNVKGIAANASTKRIYVTTTRTLTALDLVTGKILWEKPYDGGCDRLAITPDGKTIYLPSLEQGHWHVVEAASGAIIKRLETGAGAHNTLCSLDGRHAFLAGLKSPLLRVVDTANHTIISEIGPFSNVIRPFTVNAAATRCYVNLNDLLGFEIGDLTTGQKLHRIEVAGFSKGPVKRHGCPSHGVGLAPGEKEIWVTDAHNQRLHVFDNTVTPPKQLTSIELRDEPGWITFSLDGRFAYPSTGEVIDTATKKILTSLEDERKAAVQSEKMVEIHFTNGQPSRTGDQFGIGRMDGR